MGGWFFLALSEFVVDQAPSHQSEEQNYYNKIESRIMKTRVIYTDIWKDETFHSLNADTKIFYLAALLNEDIGQSRIYKCSDRMLALYSGLTPQQISKCKDDLEVAQLAFFKDGFICIASNLGFIESHYGGQKNEVARAKEFERIPKSVLDYFVALLDTVSIPYQYHIDRTINLNNKSKSKLEVKIENLTDEELEHLVEQEQIQAWQSDFIFTNDDTVILRGEHT